MRDIQSTLCVTDSDPFGQCDGLYPRCTNCAQAAATCSRPPECGDGSHPYTRALEDQVAYLEARIAAVEQQRQQQPQQNQQQQQQQQQQPLQRQERPLSQQLGALPFVDISATPDNPVPIELEDPLNATPQPRHSVADVVGLLSLGNGNAGAQAYIGSSSGYGLATDLGRMVQSTVLNKALWLSNSSKGRAETSFSNYTPSRKITLQELRTNPVEPPADVLGEKLINTYLARIHPRFPFLFRPDIWTAHRNRFSLSEENDRQQDRSEPHFASSAYHNHGLALFMLYMVYAIGALCLRLTEDYKDTSPEQFYVSAMQHVACVREADPVHNLAAIVLLVLYHLRSESRNGLWHLTGLAMRTVTDMGLHRKASTQRLGPFEAQLQRRLFWSIYALESIFASTFGRPISLSDCDIDQPLPLAVDDDERLCQASSEAEYSARANDHGPDGLTQFVLLSQLHVFEARIQRTIYRVDRTVDSLQPKMDSLLGDLEAWHRNMPTTLPKSDHDRVLLHYYRTVRILLQPFLSILHPTSEPFRKCAHAAGQICQVHKQLHRTSEYAHSFVAVHTVFVSGITLLYTLWRGREKMWSFTISNDIRAASCVLSIMGERAPWIRHFRDTFDVMVEATMAVMQEPDASACDREELRDPVAAAQEADFSIFEDLHVDHGALDMARELVEWMQF
jgi:hypothetical protein